MQFVQGELYHVYNRGNNGQTIFLERENYLYFLKKVKTELSPLCDILAYCLMPNHYHLMIRFKESKGSSPIDISTRFSRKLGTLQSSYARAINKAHQRHGSLFQQKVKSKHVHEYAHICFFYIHQNPLKASLCMRLEDWEFSSFRDYAGLRDGKLPSMDLAFQVLNIPREQEEFMKESLRSYEENIVNNFY